MLLHLENTEDLSKRPSYDRNVTGLTMRILKNGEAVLSDELVSKFNLEYNQDNAKGIDIFAAHDWDLYKASGNPNGLIIAFPSKDTLNVDFFANAKKNDTSVKDQPCKKEGLRVLEILKTLGYQIDNHVDLVVHLENKIVTSKGIYKFPHVDKKGNVTTKLRENIDVFLLQIVVS